MRGSGLARTVADLPTIDWADLKPLVTAKEATRIENKAQYHAPSGFFVQDAVILDAESAKRPNAPAVKSASEFEPAAKRPKLATPAPPASPASVEELLRTSPTANQLRDEKARNLAILDSIKDCFSLERIARNGKATQADTWRGLTLAIANACGGAGKSLWEYISARGGKTEAVNYRPVHNAEIWDESLKMAAKGCKKPLTMGTLKFWAKADSPDVYNRLFNSSGIQSNTHITLVNTLCAPPDSLSNLARIGVYRHLPLTLQIEREPTNHREFGCTSLYESQFRVSDCEDTKGAT
jgi:hypothetical protein